MKINTVANEKLSWFDRVKEAILTEGISTKLFGDVTREYEDGSIDYEDYSLRFNTAEIIPTIKIYNADFSASITIRIDEERGEIYKECYRDGGYPNEPYKIRVVYGSIPMFLDDISIEIKDIEEIEEGGCYISGWH